MSNIRKAMSVLLVFVLSVVFLTSSVFADEKVTSQDIIEAIDEYRVGAITEANINKIKILITDWEGDHSTNDPSLAGTMQTAPDTSLPYLFAKLQQDMSALTKGQVTDTINSIAAEQAQQRQIAELISVFQKTAESLAVGGNYQFSDECKDVYLIWGSDQSIDFTHEYKQLIVDLGILPANHPMVNLGSTNKLDREDFLTLASFAQMRQQQIGLQIQQEMVYLQNFIGQYNSYNSLLQNLNDQSQQALNGLSRGATMQGSGSGMLFTGILIGLAAGVVGSAVFRRMAKKDVSK